jgi:hypothetical protein
VWSYVTCYGMVFSPYLKCSKDMKLWFVQPNSWFVFLCVQVGLEAGNQTMWPRFPTWCKNGWPRRSNNGPNLACGPSSTHRGFFSLAQSCWILVIVYWIQDTSVSNGTPLLVHDEHKVCHHGLGVFFGTDQRFWLRNRDDCVACQW